MTFNTTVCMYIATHPCGLEATEFGRAGTTVALVARALDGLPVRSLFSACHLASDGDVVSSYVLACDV